MDLMVVLNGLFCFCVIRFRSTCAHASGTLISMTHGPLLLPHKRCDVAAG